jgi:dipeptide/tripeptide permease
LKEGKERVIGGMGGAIGGFCGSGIGFLLTDKIGLSDSVFKVIIVSIIAGLIAFFACKVLRLIWK